ncbi:O-antigen ligase family protein [Poseidonibacter lekithochrous]|uniref:O-antigen ligase family protein n=1 Tax=Poseidonibacter lekithochrous TaxID=1904463 RepID=UPI000D392655|nr:O-antigen ligase family protein [Poseidonibacter lekithochrous]
MNKFIKLSEKYNVDIFFLSIFFMFLPISGVTAIQNVSFLFFALFIILNFKIISFINLKKVKKFIFIFLSFLIVCIISIFFSIDYKETFSEIRGEVIKPFLVLSFVFVYIYLSSEKKILYLIITLVFSLFIHSLINLYFWYDGGLWPFRAGGLLDNGGGERFGIWATYSISISIALFFTKYKKIAIILFLVAVFSIVANNTRATFVGCLLILVSYLIFIYRNKMHKIFGLISVFFILITFIFYSKDLNHRFNVYNMISKTQYFSDYSPSEFNKITKDHGLGSSIIARLAMWKSAVLYRINEPLFPLGYGRFLFNEQINDVWKLKKENIPYSKYNQAHSDFVSILFSLGVIGLFIFILFLIYLLRITYYIYLNSEKYSYLGVFVFLGTIGYIGSMMFGSFFGDSEQLYFYALYGMALALYVKTKEEIDEIKTN